VPTSIRPTAARRAPARRRLAPSASAGLSAPSASPAWRAHLARVIGAAIGLMPAGPSLAQGPNEVPVLRPP
jgi:hypothetical protein